MDYQDYEIIKVEINDRSFGILADAIEEKYSKFPSKDFEGSYGYTLRVLPCLKPLDDAYFEPSYSNFKQFLSDVESRANINLSAIAVNERDFYSP